MKITCLNCGGKGWVKKLTSGGYHIPFKCLGCQGSGKQEVRVS